MYNLSTVFWFEVIRTLKKKSFWVVSLSFPIVAALIVTIIFLSNRATDEAMTRSSEEGFSLVVTDEANLLNPQLLDQFDAQTTDDKRAAINQVQSGNLDAYFFYPEDVSEGAVEIYAKNAGVFENSKYSGVAAVLLEESVRQTVNPVDSAVLSGSVSYQQTNFQDGEEYNAILQLIAPGVFLLLFYFLIVFFSNQMLHSTTEEKENRVIEMILTTVKARTLVVGKILSLVALGVLQTVIILTPIALGYLLLRERLNLPQLDFATLPLDWTRIGIAALILMLSFIMFTGLLVAIGAAVPTAKEASSFSGIVFMFIFGPLYAVSLFVSSPEAMIVKALTFFPFTAPIPLLLRNAVGNLETWETAIAIMILVITTIIVLALAVRIFRYGALEYSRRLSLKEMLRLRG